MTGSRHAVIVCKHSAAAILDGSKTVESRLTITRREPWGMVKPGDELLFKISGGPYAARAIVAAVDCFQGLTPDAVRRLARSWEPRVRGGPDYWHSKRTARYATMITLSGVEPISVGPHLGVTAGRAWIALPPEGLPARPRPRAGAGR